MLQTLTAEFSLFNIRLERWHWLLAIGLGLMIAVLPPLLVVAALGALVVGVAVISEPLLGLAFTLLLAPVKAWEEVFIGGPIAAVSTGQLMLLFTIAVWLARGLVQGRIAIPRTKLNAPLWLFISMSAFTVWGAPSVIDGVKELLKWVEVVFVIWMLLDLTRNFRPKTALYGTVVAMVSVGLIQALWGIWQFALRGTGPAHFIIFGRFYRATASFMQPNPYGGYMVFNLFLTIGLLAGLGIPAWRALPAYKLRKKVVELFQTTPYLPWLVGMTLLLMTALIGSWSRGSWLNFVFGLSVFIFFTPRNRQRGIILIGGSTLFFLLVWSLGLIPPAIEERLFGFISNFRFQDVTYVIPSPGDYAIVERLAHWQAAINMAEVRLWTGFGLGNYPVVYETYRLPFWPEPLGHAHNIYLNILAEMGIWGLFAYAILWVPIFVYTMRLQRDLQWPERGLALGLLGAWSGMSLHHMLDNLYVNNNFIYLGFMFGLLVMLQLQVDSQAKSP
ncbi:MAG: O-antigen ligase family protein [Candidatus Promineifilaceae bacterium]